MNVLDDEINSWTYGERLQEHGIYVFMDPVNSETIKPVIEWILHENYVSKHKKQELVLMINSEGGNLTDAFALIDVMNDSRVPIKTVGLGQISSSGLLIFISGAPGRRWITPNTSILSHQFSWQNEGKVHELFATVRELELTHKRMINHYKKYTGADDEIIREYLLPAQDRWLSAEEALKLNVCDKVSQNINQSTRRKAVK